MHLAINPLAFVARLAVGVDKLALPMEKVILEVAFIHRSVYSSLFTMKALFAFLIHALVSLPIDRRFPALAMLAIVEELTLVAVLDLPLSVLSLQLTLATGESVEEHTSDHGPRLGERLGALTMRLAGNEATLILIAVWPTNLAFSVRQPLILILARINAHLPRVDRAVRHRALLLHLSLVHTGHLADVGERIECDIGQLVAD